MLWWGSVAWYNLRLTSERVKEKSVGRSQGGGHGAVFTLPSAHLPPGVSLQAAEPHVGGKWFHLHLSLIFVRGFGGTSRKVSDKCSHTSECSHAGWGLLTELSEMFPAVLTRLVLGPRKDPAAGQDRN